jgi:hypothetical protein
VVLGDDREASAGRAGHDAGVVDEERLQMGVVVEGARRGWV